jgi:nicotinamidase-related amidase
VSIALLVIDVQRGLFDPDPRPFEADAVIARINALTARARAADVPVVFVQHEETYEGGLVVGSDAWQLQGDLQVESRDAIVRKATPDAFLRTELEELLGSWNVRHLVICGYASECCVDSTVRRAAALGYGVTLASDAHTTHDQPHATGAQIRIHENAVLPGLTSFGPKIVAVPSGDIAFP